MKKGSKGRIVPKKYDIRVGDIVSVKTIEACNYSGYGLRPKKYFNSPNRAVVVGVMIPKVRCSIIEEPYFLKAIPIDFDWYEGVSPDYDNVVLATGDFNSCPKCQKFSKKKTCCEITPILSPIYKRVINSKGDVMDMVDVDLYTLYAAYKHRLFYFSWAEETGLSITLSYDDLVVQYSLKPF